MSARSSIEAVIEREVGRWEMTRRMSRRAGPCIALARLPGAGGAEVARRLAERLGYGLFDKQIVEEIARQSGVQAGLVAKLDERIRHVIDRYVTDAFRKGVFAESDYLSHVVRTQRALAESGGAVILGRGATYVLTAREALRVWVVAPRAIRIENRAKARGIASEEAAREIEKEETTRLDFVRHHFHLDQRDATLYDLVVNTGTISVDSACEVILLALQRQFPQAR